MEPGVVGLLILILLIAATVGVLVKQRPDSWNLPLLRTAHSSFLRQLERALVRGDAVAVNHRAAAFLASAFDVLLAVNRVLHPGEKRLVSYAEATCALRPDGLRDLAVGVARAGPDVVARADALARALEALAADEGLA